MHPSMLTKHGPRGDQTNQIVQLTDQHFHTDLDRAPTVPSFSECPGHVIDHSDPRSIDWAGVQHAIGAACDAKRVLVEGTFALEHPIRELARWAVYLHTPDDVRLARKILRKFEDGGDPRASLLGYLARGRAAHHQHVASKRSFADFELDGAQTVERLVDQLSTAIRL